MSNWFTSEFSDLDLDTENDELYINVYVTNDNFGSIYTQIKVEDMIKFLKENKLIS